MLNMRVENKNRGPAHASCSVLPWTILWIYGHEHDK